MYQSKSFLPPSKLTDEEIEMLLNQRQQMRELSREMNVNPPNVYNRSRMQPPRVKIGNWFEETALWESKEALGLDPTSDKDVGAGETLKDTRIDPRDNYCSSNREYGVPINKLNEEYQKTLNPKSFTMRQSTQLKPPPEEKRFNQRESIDLLNKWAADKNQIDYSITRSTYLQLDGESEEIEYKKEYPVTVHRINVVK